MTFIISAASKNGAFQVSDTRLTKPVTGILFDDLSVKLTIVHCRDAKLAISYAGLATIGGVRTNKWITDTLMQFKAWDKVFQETTNYLRDTLTRTLRLDKSREKYGLQIDIVGLGVSPKGIRQPAIACITNRSEPDASRNHSRS
jgi:hypothetical protein